VSSSTSAWIIRGSTATAAPILRSSQIFCNNSKSAWKPGRAAAVAPILRSSSWICSKIYAPKHSIDCQLLEGKKAIISPQLRSTSGVARIRSSTAPIRARQKSTFCAPPASSLRSRTSSS
jgi:hypothetical protein